MGSKSESWAQSLGDVKKVLDKNKIIWFLDMGTLLGAYRDGDFIPWDNDIDLGIVQENELHEKIIQSCKDLEANGYDVAYIDKSISITKKPDVEINIVIYKDEDGHLSANYLVPSKYYSIRYGIKKIIEGKYYVHSKSKRHQFSRVIITRIKAAALFSDIVFDLVCGELNYKKIKIESEYLLHLKDFTFKNINVKVPLEAEDYLTVRYGQDWKMPKREWTYFEDDKSISN